MRYIIRIKGIYNFKIEFKNEFFIVAVGGAVAVVGCGDGSSSGGGGKIYMLKMWCICLNASHSFKIFS